MYFQILYKLNSLLKRYYGFMKIAFPLGYLRFTALLRWKSRGKSGTRKSFFTERRRPKVQTLAVIHTVVDTKGNSFQHLPQKMEPHYHDTYIRHTTSLFYNREFIYPNNWKSLPLGVSVFKDLLYARITVFPILQLVSLLQ